MLKRSILIMTALSLFTAVTAVNATEQESTQMDKWQFFAQINGYLPDIKGKTAGGNDIEIDLDTIIDNLNFTFMGIAGASKGKWTFTTDLIYLDMGADESGTAPVNVGGGNLPVQTYTSLGLTAWIVTPAASYNVLNNERFRLDILAGARYFYLKADLRLDIGPFGKSPTESDSVWDGIVGVRGDVKLNDKWFLPYYFDIGTGESDLTYQLYGGIGYRFSKIDLSAGYRYLRWNFDDDTVFDNLYQTGPMVGIKFRF